ncbi:MAG: YesL family protein [Oscillospiraceae bacterium]|nr:YesL family protein [Oscillospiraceae bacterium]
MGLFPQRMFEGADWRRRHGEPANRRQLFQCVLTDQFFSLIPVNLLFLLFVLPAAVWSMICLPQVVSAAQAENGDGVIAAVDLWTLGLVPALTLLGPARAGMALLMRDWAQEEYVKVWPTFWKGLRDNWKQTLLPAFFTAVLPLALWSAYRLSSVLLIAAAVAGVLYQLAMQVYYVLLVTYDLRAMQHFRNAVLLTLMELPAFVLVFLGSHFVPLAILGVYLIYPNAGYWNLLILLGYETVIGAAVTHLASASLANKVREEHLQRDDP